MINVLSKRRVFRILPDNSMEEITFKDIKTGDKFKILEVGNNQVLQNTDGTDIFVAASDGYEENGIWTVKVE